MGGQGKAGETLVVSWFEILAIGIPGCFRQPNRDS